MVRKTRERKVWRAGHEVRALYYDAVHEPALHDALLCSALCPSPENSLSAPADFLHRSPDLRAAHSRVCLSWNHVDRARDPRLESCRARRARKLGDRTSLDLVCAPNFLLDPAGLPAGLGDKCDQEENLEHKRDPKEC